jgi:hypothetical protein
VANSEPAQVSNDGLVVTIGHDRRQEDWEVKLDKPRCVRSVLGPCRNRRVRAAAVTNGHKRSRESTGRRPSSSGSWDNAHGRFGLWSRRAGVRVPSVTPQVAERVAEVVMGVITALTRPAATVMSPGLVPPR